MNVTLLRTPVTSSSAPASRATVRDILHKVYPYDAHFTAYAAPRRLTLADISALDETSTPFVEVVPLDLDLPGHGVWADHAHLLDEVRALVTEHPVLKGAGLYTTLHGARVLMRPAAPVPLTHYGSYLAQLYEALSDVSLLDHACKDPTRLFRAANVTRYDHVRVGTLFEQHNPREVRAAVVIDPVAPTTWSPPKPLVRGASVRQGRVPEQTCPDFALYRDKRTCPKKGDLAPLKGHDLYDVLTRGWPLHDEVGGRHAAIVSAVGAAVRVLKLRTPRAVVDVLGHSVALMADKFPTDPRSSSLWGELWDVSRWTLSFAQGERDAVSDEREAQEAEAQETMRALAKELDCDEEEARQRLVIYSGRAFYVYNPSLGRYVGEFTEVTLPTGIRDNCPLIDPVAYSPSGAPVGLRNARDILFEHGATASGTVYNYTGRNTFDGNTLHLSECKVRKATPRFDPDIDRWLRCYGDKLVDWLAGLKRVDRPTALAYIMGVRGSGKSFLAVCCASVYDGAFTAFDDLTSDFNESLRRSPIVWGDEGASWRRDKNPADAIRRIVTTGTNVLKRKYMDNTGLTGYARVLLTANNDSFIEFRKALTSEDITALEERVLFVTADDSAAKVLADIREKLTREYGETAVTCNGLERAWIDEGRFADHVEWLTHNHTYTPGYRLLVEGTSSAWSQTLRSRHGTQYPILAAVAHAVSSPSLTPGQPVFLGDGGVWVNSNSLLSLWSQGRLGTDEVVAAGVLSRGLATLADRNVRKLGKGAARVNYHRLDPQVVLDVAEELGLPNLDTLKQRAAAPLREEDGFNVP